MAVLEVIKGSQPGKLIPLKSTSVLGRHHGCDIVVESVAVSRQHARITEDQGVFFIEDLSSRNGTLVNEVTIFGRTPLELDDLVTLCDHTYRFLPDVEGATAPVQARRRKAIDLNAADATHQDDSDGELDLPPRSDVIVAYDLQPAGASRLSVNPEAKLRAVLEIGRAMARTLDREQVLQAILQQLFRVFPAADHGFVLLRDADDKVTLEATLARRPGEANEVPLSMTIVKRALESRQALLSADVQGDQRFDTSQSLSALSIRSVMCVPLIPQDAQPLGVLQISTAGMVQPFEDDDLDLLMSISGQVTLAVENSLLHETLLEKHNLDKELQIATQVQRGFLPRSRPQIPGYEFADHYAPAKHIGGDYFDYIPLGDGRLAIAIGDVAGKGISAALLMARLSSGVRYQLVAQSSPGTALRLINDELSQSGLGYRFVTLQIAILDPVAGSLHIANAGHLPPLLRSANGSVQAIGREESGMPLGLAGAGYHYTDVRHTLEPGETLVFYTDGITEAMNAEHQLVGSRSLMDWVHVTPAFPETMVSGILEHVSRFCGEEVEQRDDMCLVALHRSAELVAEAPEPSTLNAAKPTVVKPRKRR